MKKYHFTKWIASLLIASLLAIAAVPVASAAQTVPDVDNSNPIPVTQAGQTAEVNLSLTKLEESKVFSATVSAEIPVYQDTDGTVLVADKARIENKSTHSIKVSQLDVTAKNGYNVVSSTNGVADGTKQVALKLRGESITKAGTATLTESNWTIDKNNQLPLNMEVTMPKNQEEGNFATLTFTLDWAGSDTPDTPVTPDPPAVTKHTVHFQAGANGKLSGGDITVQVQAGTKAPFPTTMTEEGYLFDKWIDQAGNEVDPDTPITKPMTFTALFKEDADPAERYTIDDSGYITGFSNTFVAASPTQIKLKIPSEINGKEVKGIAEGAFATNYYRTVVGLSTVSDAQSTANGEIISVTFPETAIAIKKCAFAGCRKLHTIDLKNITTLGEAAFIQGEMVAFLDDGRLDLSNVTTIGNQCFNGCFRLKDITFNNNVRIGNSAFLACNKLSEENKTFILSRNASAFSD